MKGTRIELTEVRCELVGQTEKAWRVAIDGTEYWVGKSISAFEHDSSVGTLTVPSWWLSSKNKVQVEEPHAEVEEPE